MNTNRNIVITVVVAVLVAGAAGFFGGMTYGKSQTSAKPQFNGNALGSRTGIQPGQGVNRNGFKPVSGQIISTDASSITVKMNDGSSKIVLLGGTTVVNKTATASKDDLKVGETVMVIGTSNTDGSVTAQTVNLNPEAPAAPPTQ